MESPILKMLPGGLIELALARIRAGAESLEDARPYRAEEVTRTLREGSFLGTPTMMDTFNDHSAWEIVDLLDNVSNDLRIIPEIPQHRIGQELRRTLATSLWNGPRVQSKLAHCSTVVEGFVQRTLDATECMYTALQKAV